MLKQEKPLKGVKPLKAKQVLKSRTTLRTSGSVARKWIKVRNQWFKQNPPNKKGLYYCYLCSKPLVRDLLSKYGEIEKVTLDHVKSRSSHPELRFVLSNLKPCCWECNTEKGSKNY